MMNELEKMDALKERLNVTYAQAKEALDKTDGDLAQALVYLEEQGAAGAKGRGEDWEDEAKEPKWSKENAENFVRGLIEQIKSVIQEGNVTKVRLISGRRTLIEIPATFGVVGLGVMLFSPLLLAVTAVGAAAAVVKEMVFEVEKADGTIERRSLKFTGFGNKKEEGDSCPKAAGSDGEGNEDKPED
jgi:hypothetical protein